MPRVGFEHTIPVFERAKTFHHASDRKATVIGSNNNFLHKKRSACKIHLRTSYYFYLSESTDFRISSSIKRHLFILFSTSTSKNYFDDPMNSREPICMDASFSNHNILWEGGT
jgi:hypothetical protein